MAAKNAALKSSGTIAFALALTLMVGITTGGSAEQKKSFDYGDIQEVELSLVSITSLPNDVIILGGSYRTPSDPVHSCILISHDAGKTWSDVPLRFGEATVSRFQTDGKRMVWALIVNSKEGSEWPEYLLISRNSGMTWETVSLSFIGPPGPLLAVEDFRFLDASHGILSTRDSLGRGRTYQTSNAGKSWKRIWDTSADYPDLGLFKYPTEVEPLHTSLWTRDKPDATGLLRVLLDETRSQRGIIGPYIVQRMETLSYPAGSASPPHITWANVAEIPVYYAIRNGSLQPLSAGAHSR